MAFDTKELDRFPLEPGVYLMKDEEGRVIYVGKAKNVRVRVKQYFSGHDEREIIPHLIAEIESIDTIVVTSEKEALILENNLIKKHWPKYNACLKDDKTYFSLMINHKDEWPMIRVVRFRGKPPSDALYFGPYTKGYAARETLELLRRLFPLRQCSDRELLKRTRPCILHGLKRCIAPCVGKCTKQEYDGVVKRAVDFLKGHDKELLKKLHQEMQTASENLEFEKADALLKTIRNIEATLEKQHVEKAGTRDSDILGIYREGDSAALTQLFFREGKLIGSFDHLFTRCAEDDDELLTTFILQNYLGKEILPAKIIVPIDLKDEKDLKEILQCEILTAKKGEKKQLLEMAQKNALAKFKREEASKDLKERVLIEMEEKLHLTNYPERIECFDNSNLSGVEPVSAMVCFDRGEKDKSGYRKYKIKPELASDDYGALREVLQRRYSKAKEEDNLPDLLLIDGGKGHLNIATEILSELDVSTVDVIAISKDESKHTKGITAEKIFITSQNQPLLFNVNSPILFFLQKIRDEAHRFAITFQRNRRSKRTMKSALDDIPGIGPIKRKRLLTYFGSLKKILEATEEELLKVKGITKKDIETLLKKKSDFDKLI